MTPPLHASSTEFSAIVFSHLRWNFVWQRPQHLLTRLGKHYRIYFVEEPVYSEGEPHWEIISAGDGVTVCRPHTSVKEAGFDDAQMPVLHQLLLELVNQEKIDRCLAWFYSPMAFPLLETVDPHLVIYDCMDELSAFMHAPARLIHWENELLDRADLVFTGGRSLYGAKRHRNPSVHCFPSSVDSQHFGQAREAASEPAEQASLPHPRLGFFGVIDERLDISLVKFLAEQRPEWQFIFVGPVVKIDPSTLPRGSNVHYLGQRKYEDLPAFLSGWDVCLLPFALNESTKFISPTKTLEYMAAEKPIVSTPITDVREGFPEIVYIGETHQQFLDACDAALNASHAENKERTERMRAVLSGTSWEQTAQAMFELIQAQRDVQVQSSFTERSREEETPADELHRKTIVIGAGPTGLSAAYHLGENSLLLEQNDTIGGWCRSMQVEGFTFDYAGHIMFSADPDVLKLYELLLGENVHWQNREAWIYTKKTYTRYPFQGALYGLPVEVIKECLLGAIQARYGRNSSHVSRPNGSNGHTLAGPKCHTSAERSVRLSSGQTVATAVSSFTTSLPVTPSVRSPSPLPASVSNPLGDVKDCCGDGVMESTAELVAASVAESKPANFEEFIYQVWGEGIAKHFAIPYNRKLWAVPLTEMETSWLGGRVPMPDLGEMIEGALRPVPAPMGPNARFGYPLRGGFQALMDGFLPLLKGELQLKTGVKRIFPREHRLQTTTSQIYEYEHLISTMPLPALVRALGDEAPIEVQTAARHLKNISVRCVNLGVGRENITEKHWIYYPEDTIFHRIFVQGNASPHCNPPGGFGLTCEITYHNEYKPLPCDGEELIQRCIDDCRRVGIIAEDDPILVANQVDMPFAYVVYDHARPQDVKLIRDWLFQHDIHLAGRYSEWEYYNSDHAFIAGRQAARTVQDQQRTGAVTKR